MPLVLRTVMHEQKFSAPNLLPFGFSGPVQKRPCEALQSRNALSDGPKRLASALPCLRAVELLPISTSDGIRDDFQKPFGKFTVRVFIP